MIGSVWEAMVREPDLDWGFNRLDSTILKACDGKVIAKEVGRWFAGTQFFTLIIPKAFGVVIKIAHGWNAQATWYLARSILGVLGFDLRNPYALHRQKAFIVPESSRSGIYPQSKIF